MCSPLVSSVALAADAGGCSGRQPPRHCGKYDKGCVSKTRPAVQRPTKIYVSKVPLEVHRPNLKPLSKPGHDANRMLSGLEEIFCTPSIGAAIAVVAGARPGNLRIPGGQQERSRWTPATTREMAELAEPGRNQALKSHNTGRAVHRSSLIFLSASFGSTSLKTPMKSRSASARARSHSIGTGLDGSDRRKYW